MSIENGRRPEVKNIKRAKEKVVDFILNKKARVQFVLKPFFKSLLNVVV